MVLKTVSLLAIAFSALALVPYGAHLLSLPNKIAMTQDQYFSAQRAYDNWGLVSLILIPAMLLNIGLTLLVRAQPHVFPFALAGCLAMAATLAIFFAFTYPANVATENWTTMPDNWETLRTRWEYSHAGNAILVLVSLVLITYAALWAQR